MRRAALLLLAACALTACVAETVERRRPRFGPVREVGYVDFGGGQVRYSSEGWSLAVASRRRLAFRLMRSNCGSDLSPVVTDEYSRLDADAPFAGEDIASNLAIGGEHYTLERYIHLLYECRPPDWTEPAPSTAPAHAPLLTVPSMPALPGEPSPGP